MEKAVVFDGRLRAREIKDKLKGKVTELKKKGITPKLVSILVGKNKASSFYLDLKKKQASEMGVLLEVKVFSSNTAVNKIVDFIKLQNKNERVHGIMVQLPLPKAFSTKDRKRIIDAISRKKDVDGMREDSLFTTPVVKAVLEAINSSSQFLPPRPLKDTPLKVVVVGARGFVGKRVVKKLQKLGFEVEGIDIDTAELGAKTLKADILISATGKPNLIKGEMVKEKAVVIDVGAPRGDVLFSEVWQRASFITPVPGGIGPLTIAFLLENLIDAIYYSDCKTTPCLIE